MPENLPKECNRIWTLYNQDFWSISEAKELIKHAVACENCGDLLLNELAVILSYVGKQMRMDFIHAQKKKQK